MIVPPEIRQENKRIIAACEKSKLIKKCFTCKKGLKDDNIVLSVILVNTRNREPGKPKIKPYRFCSDECMEKWDSRGY
jgi:hypothetical protein